MNFIKEPIKYLISGLLLLFFASCQRCQQVENHLLTQGQKEQNPFKGYEKLIYSSGDSVIEFIGTQRINEVHEYDISNFSCD